MTKLVLEGWRPEDAKPSTLTVKISGETVHTAEIADGLFRVEAPISVDADSALHLQISNTSGFTPENDARQLCFVLRELAFA